MTLDEYIEHKEYKPLTEKEISNGKSRLRIYGTNEPMPWSTIYTRIAAGQPMEEITSIYGHARKISLFAQLEGISHQPKLEEIVQTEVQQRQTLQAVANQSEEAAQTLMMMVNEIAPTFQQEVAEFANEVVVKARTKLKEPFLEATDILALTKAVQTVTDTTGHTQRFASQGNTTNNTMIQVEGFDFQLDNAPIPTLEMDTSLPITDIIIEETTLSEH